MSAQPQALAPVTAAALLALGDDGRRWELVEGEWRALAPAGFEHGRVSMRVGSRLDAHVEKTGAGVVVAAETGFRIAAIRTPSEGRTSPLSRGSGCRRVTCSGGSST